MDKLNLCPNVNGPLTNHTIVLDLDETLVHSVDNMSILTDLGILTNPKYMDLRPRIFKLRLDNVVTKPGSGVVHEMWGIIRPHAELFLSFCFRYFRRVVIWTAGQQRYANAIVQILFRRIGWPDAVLTADDCSRIRGREDEFFKPLRRVLGYNVPRYLNSEAEALNDQGLNNILILDDRKTNFSLCNPNNGVLIPAYDPDLDIESIRRDDVSLVQFMEWLCRPHVMISTDVRKLNKNIIFTPDLFTSRYNLKNQNEYRTANGARFRSPYPSTSQISSSKKDDRKEEYYLIPTRQILYRK